DTAISDPPLMITARGRDMRIEALNERGEAMLAPLSDHLAAAVADADLTERAARLTRFRIHVPGRIFSEDERPRMPSVFSVLREVVNFFRSEEDPNLGLYGAFGYDLAFQFDPIDLKIERPE